MQFRTSPEKISSCIDRENRMRNHSTDDKEIIHKTHNISRYSSFTRKIDSFFFLGRISGTIRHPKQAKIQHAWHLERRKREYPSFTLLREARKRGWTLMDLFKHRWDYFSAPCLFEIKTIWRCDLKNCISHSKLDKAIPERHSLFMQVLS
ncbi:hypothetical protein CEXT_198221 [Caerostris extrusa]|uniref:Maturase K n=1 Tax=Caerostris extrusa TaxID=172846 RepID=A0AAV4MZY1_CAEEX|nr:hypothetical protein CEXT_198221 [Caerostris extrusa]